MACFQERSEKNQGGTWGAINEMPGEEVVEWMRGMAARGKRDPWGLTWEGSGGGGEKLGRREVRRAGWDGSGEASVVGIEGCVVIGDAGCGGGGRVSGRLAWLGGRCCSFRGVRGVEWGGMRGGYLCV
ncbi:hypothetical protein Tco_0261379 [Tanacetum coccineum]